MLQIQDSFRKETLNVRNDKVPAAREKHVSSMPAISRRTFLASGIAAGASLLLGQMAEAESSGGDGGLKEYDIATNGISLHVTEQGEGPAVLFCHGFPDTCYTRRRQMRAIASAGYLAIAPDMRGYGRSSAPADATLYTPLQTTGDLVGLLDVLKIPSVVVVGHDWGAAHAWGAGLMRPDRFKALFCLSVPYVPRGDISVFEKSRCQRGRSQITSLITSLNSGVPAFTVA